MSRSFWQSLFFSCRRDPLTSAKGRVMSQVSLDSRTSCMWYQHPRLTSTKRSLGNWHLTLRLWTSLENPQILDILACTTCPLMLMCTDRASIFQMRGPSPALGHCHVSVYFNMPWRGGWAGEAKDDSGVSGLPPAVRFPPPTSLFQRSPLIRAVLHLQREKSHACRKMLS